MLQTQQDAVLAQSLGLPPVDGKANAERIKHLANYCQVPPTAIEIKSGQSSRLKGVEID